METAAVNGMNIANCSWSFEATTTDAEDSPFYTCMQILKNIGVLVIAAAGNDNLDLDVSHPLAQKKYPASYDLDNILTATTYDCFGQLAGYSNYGINHVDIALPGNKIPGVADINQLGWLSGTSQSAAILTGIAANLGTYQQQFDYQEIICAIMNSANYHPVIDQFVKSDGLINADEALTLLGNCTHTTNPPTRRSSLPSTNSIYPNPANSIINLNLYSDTANNISCLLYTSPSPRDATLSRMPSSA